MQATRIIKKYPNRRLYDTELSRYVTLSDVRELVMQGMEFKVVDTATAMILRDPSCSRSCWKRSRVEPPCFRPKCCLR